MASKYEASPNIVREAAAHSIPTIYAASCKGGTHEIAKHSGVRLNFEKKIEDLYEKLITLNFHENNFRFTAGSKIVFNKSWAEMLKNEAK